MKKAMNYGLPPLLLALAIVGARLESIPIMYAFLGLVCVVVVLSVYGMVEERIYPVLLFSIGLGLLYQVTLISNYLVGTDIHYEYYFAYMTEQLGYWDYTIERTYNSAVITTVAIPLIAKFLHIDFIWMFKVVCPLFLAGVPVVMYYIFRQQITPKQSFLAVFFFLTVPTFFLELTGIAKQELAEFFFILCAFFIIDRRLRIRMGWRLVAVFVLAMLTVVAHYTMGGAIIFYLVGIIPILLILRYLGKKNVQVPIKYLSVVVVAIVVLSVAFYGFAGDGKPLREIVNRGSVQLYRLNLIERPYSGKSGDGVVEIYEFFVSGDEAPPEVKRAEEKKALSKVVLPEPEKEVTPSAYVPTTWEDRFPMQRSPLVMVALGADFPKASPLGKMFRIIQYATQILVIVGCAYILRYWRRYSAEYLAFFGMCGVLLVLCVFMPGFAPILNASRFYHLSLFFLAPAVVLGGKLILRNYKVLVLTVFIPYFIFTSGVVFEATKQTELSYINIPYNHALSAVRADTTPIFTDADGVVRDWVVENKLFPVYGDSWGNMFLVEKLGPNCDEVRHFNRGLYEIDGRSLMRSKNLNFSETIEPDCYIYLRERNTELRELTFYTGIGLRKYKTFDETRMDDLLEGREVIFQCENAKVYGHKH